MVRLSQIQRPLSRSECQQNLQRTPSQHSISTRLPELIQSSLQVPERGLLFVLQVSACQTRVPAARSGRERQL